jgi:hypothetical protein
VLNFLSFAWAGLGITLALAAPRMSGLPSWTRTGITVVALSMTAGLIIANLTAAWMARRRTERLSAALPRTLLALGLFNLLFIQVACHLGANHFESSAAPGPEDWLVNCGAVPSVERILRASTTLRSSLRVGDDANLVRSRRYPYLLS